MGFTFLILIFLNEKKNTHNILNNDKNLLNHEDKQQNYVSACSILIYSKNEDHE